MVNRHFLTAMAAIAVLAACSAATHASPADITKCDELAALPDDRDNPPDIKGHQDITEVAAALAACKAAAAAPDAPRRSFFELGRAYESLGNRSAARRAYEQALRTCDPDGELHEPLLGQIDLSDVVAAARTRLDALTAIGTGTR